MASIIRVKRSTGTTAPATLNYGELALTVGNGTQANKGDRLFVGNSSGNPIDVGGKYYTDLLDHVHGTLTASSAAIVDSSSKIDRWNVDNLRLDGNTLSSTDTDGNITITPNGTGRVQFLDDDELQFGDSDDIRLSYDTAKDALFFERGGAGNTADIRIADDIHFQFGTDNDARIYYDEASTDKLQIEGADWNFANGVAITISDTTQSTDKDTGALVVEGGVGIEKNLFVGGTIAVTGITTITDTTDSTSTTTGALIVAGGVGIGKTVHIGGDLNVNGGDLRSTSPTFNLINESGNATINAFGEASTIGIGSTTATLTLRPNTVVGVNATQNLYDTVATTLNFGRAATTFNIGANSGTLTIGNPTVVGTQSTQNLYNSTATTVNAFGAATSLNIGANTGALTIGNPQVVGTQATQKLYDTVATTVTSFGEATSIGIGSTAATLTLRPNIVVGVNATQNLYNTVATTVNAFGAATSLNIGANSGTLTIGNPTIVGTQATQTLFNTTATKVDAFGAATNIVLGATTGVATIRNATVDLDGDLNIDGGDLTSNLTSFNLLNSNVNEANVLQSATSIVIGNTTGITTIRNDRVRLTSTQDSSSTSTGALVVDGGVGIAKTLNVGGSLNVSGPAAFTSGNVTITNNLTVNGNTALGNAATDTTTITGSLIHNGFLTNTGGVTIDNIGISSNVISTRSGGGNTLFIDPFPDGLSNEGTVVIKGDLQVDGTTTTVNSNNVSVNEAILNLGDVTSVRTVTEAVASGVSTIRLDSITGINTGDTVQGSSALPNSGIATVSSYDSVNKIITVQGTTSAGIAITTQLTITHAFDTNTDRGISFDYNTSSGTSNNKVGFFGYRDTTSANSAAPARAWTFIPDATITNNVVTGTRGNLDIKGIYYQTGDFNTHGVVFFDSDGLQTSTNNPNTASATLTSTQILTAVTEITLTVTSTSVTAGDQVTQVNNSSAYGVVKTTSSGTTITLIGVQGTFDTTNDLKVNGTNISIVPSAVNTVYTNKPMWTDTLDGGTF